MDKEHFDEMWENFSLCERNGLLSDRNIYLFGHCEATVTLADLLLEKGYRPIAILDNSDVKQGMDYQGIPIWPPGAILGKKEEKTDCDIVLIASRFYESMNVQLRQLGYEGAIKKLVNYNTCAEYSLSREAIGRMKARVAYGKNMVEQLKQKYPKAFRFFCPFPGLGDVYFCMSYLPYFIKERDIGAYIVCVVGEACADVVSLFADCGVEVMKQRDMDAAIQAELYTQDEDFFIVHQDRPYVVNLPWALNWKKISLEDVYCSGVFGLPISCGKYEPSVSRWREYGGLEEIDKGKAVILSPYAKSVTPLPHKLWDDIVKDYKQRGFQVYTNVVGAERPLRGTTAISPSLREMKSVVERAGVFIGIRSGLCDVLQTAECKKVALYPDYNYCGTKWKAVEMYALDEFENVVVGEGFMWKTR